MQPTKSVRLLALLGMGFLSSTATPVEPPAPDVEPLEANATLAQMQAAVSNVRVGKRLLPKRWPGGARVAVCITFDVDNELAWHQKPLPAPMAEGEYGARQAMPRILSLLERYDVPASFFIPVVSAELHPEIVPEILKRGRHEIGVHGWVHELASAAGDSRVEKDALERSIAYLTRVIGKRPVGYRAPSWDFSPDTMELVKQAGFLYDSSLAGMDDPYELVSKGGATGVVELPVSLILDDWPYFDWAGDSPPSLPSPELVYENYKAEFDGAYSEGGLFLLTMHPRVIGHRSRIEVLERLLLYIKSKDGVWFATLGEVANYVKQPSAH